MTSASFIHCTACEILISIYNEGSLFRCPRCHSDEYTKFIALGITGINMSVFYTQLPIRDIEGNIILQSKDIIDLKKLKLT